MADLRYPVYDLNSALEVARLMLERGGGTASLQSLAAFLNYKNTNQGAFVSRVGAARLFGLIDGPGNDLFVTKRARDILQPDYPDTEARARLDAFLSVPLYRAFLEQYEGQVLPPVPGMQNALASKFGVPLKRSKIALARLLDSAEQADLFQVAGNRTRMVRPSWTPSTAPSREPGGRPETAGEPPGDAGDDRGIYPWGESKLIEGALWELPQENAWSEEGLRDWLALMELALRVRYRLPRLAGDAEQE